MPRMTTDDLYAQARRHLRYLSATQIREYACDGFYYDLTHLYGFDPDAVKPALAAIRKRKGRRHG